MKLTHWTSVLLLLCAALAQAAPQTLTPMPDAPQAPLFVLPDMQGQTRSLADYQGKPVIVNFWATWCPPCRREMPSMQRAWEQLRGQGIEMLAVNVGETEDKVFPFLADYPLEFPILFDHRSEVMNRWPVKGLPTTFVLDGQGRIVYRAVGGREWDDPALLEKIRGLAQ